MAPFCVQISIALNDNTLHVQEKPTQFLQNGGISNASYRCTVT